MTLTNLQKAEADLLRITSNLQVLEEKMALHRTVPLEKEEVKLYLKYAEKIEKELEENLQKMLYGSPEHPNAKVTENKGLVIRNLTILTTLNSLKAAFPKPPPTPVMEEIKLPKLELKTFNGEPINWSSFRDIYTAVVHNKLTLSNAQKLAHLQSLVTDEAARLINMFELDDANYDLAWKALNDRYENQREQIFAILHKLINKSSAQPTSSSVRDLLDTARGSVRAFNNLKGNSDTLFIFIIFTKLDSATKELWFQTMTATKVPTLDEVYGFLEQRATALAAGSASTTAAAQPPRQPRFRQNDRTKVGSHVTSFGQPPPQCSLCQLPHRLYKCFKFHRMTERERKEHVNANHLCHNCLQPTSAHSSTCETSSCKVCNQRHHTLLHEEHSSSNQSRNQANQFSKTVVNSNYANHAAGAPPGFLGTALVQVRGPNGKHYCRVLLDGGSEGSFMTSSCADKLGLSRSRASASINGVMNTAAGSSSGSTNFTFTPHFSAHPKFQLTAYVVPQISSNHPSHKIDRDSLYHTRDIQLADPQFDVESPIDILIGSELFWELLENETRRGLPSQPIATKTALGWVVAGRRTRIQPFIQISSHITNIELNDKLEMFWKSDSLPESNALTSEEKECAAHFSKTITRDFDGRFVASIPWKIKRPPLGESRAIALRRLYSMEKRLSNPKNKHFKDEYIKFMREYEAMGHMKLLSSSNPVIPLNYIPHQYVIKEDSTTTKFRVVFDASAKTTSGYSLNDCMMVGPTIQSSLYCIHLRFRMNKIAYSADICKMYRQIRIPETDQQYHIVLWREDPSLPVKEYGCTTVTYGTASAPYLSTRTLHQLADECQEIYPIAAAKAKEDFYIDDLRSSKRPATLSHSTTTASRLLAFTGILIAMTTVSQLIYLQANTPSGQFWEKFLQYSILLGGLLP